MFLKKRQTENLKELAKVAQQYISAHQCQLAQTSNRDMKKVNPDKGEVDKNMKCFNLNCLGRKAMDCGKPKKERQKTGKPFVKCNYCGKTGHEFKDCWNRKTKAAVAYTEEENVSNNENVNEVSSGFLMDENKRMSNEDISECVKDNKLHLANGTRVDIITNV